MNTPGAPGDATVPVDDALVQRLAAGIEERAVAVRARIDAVATRDVRIVAVTKGHPVEVALAARRAGFVDLGENYAQELRAKAAVLDGVGLGRGGVGAHEVRWHFVGRLQANKVRTIAGVVALWESLDRASVIDEVAKRAPGSEVMVQVDLAGIEGRGGCARGEAPALVERAAAAGLVVVGLMGVGPPGEPEGSREGFRWLRREADRLGLAEVSMGMSGDLEVAVAEGSTMVRVGSDLVGERPARPG